jgi:hypothetical protein
LPIDANRAHSEVETLCLGKALATERQRLRLIVAERNPWHVELRQALFARALPTSVAARSLQYCNEIGNAADRITSS